MLVSEGSQRDPMFASETRNPQRTQSRAISLQREALRREGRLKRKRRGMRLSDLPERRGLYEYGPDDFKAPVAKTRPPTSEQVYHSYRRLCLKHDGGKETASFRNKLAAFASCPPKAGDILAIYRQADVGYQGYRDRDRVVELVLVLTTSDSNCRIATVRFAGDLITYQGAVFFHEKTCGRLGVIPNHVTWLYPRDSEVYARVGWISRAKLAHVQCRVDEEIDRARAVPELPYPFEDEDGELLESTAEPVLE